VPLAEAPSFHQPVIDYDGNCTGGQDYRVLAAQMIAQEYTWEK